MIGTMLGSRYELLKKIGEGGMAEVYKAKCHKLNRFDAVKILKKEFSGDNELVEKFKREATAVANLSDNNIINIFDVGSQDDIHYIVMEYVNGKTLKQIIQENVRLSYEKAMELAIQIARALDCAHRNNIIHRDVKPQNILVTEEGVVKVTDFGIAKSPTSVTITNSNKVMGSAHYFSPEQAKGNFVDCRTDIYSLGIVLYEMVTGKVPYDAESPVSVALKHIQEQVVPPRQINPSIPESLNKLILKAIEKDANKRYQSAKEMLIDLIRIQKDVNYDIIPSNVEDEFTRVMEPVNVKEAVDEEDIEEDSKGRISRRTKNILIVSLAAVLVIVLGAVAGWLYSKKDKPNTPPIVNSEPLTVPEVIGLTQDEAKKKIEALGLKFEVTDKEPSDKPQGTVLNTIPAVGTTVQPKAEIRIRVSSGPSTNKVPNFKEWDKNTAVDLIKRDYTLGTVEEKFSSTVQTGLVIDQDPQPDAAASKNTKINLIVSKGPEYRTVPALLGKTLSEAENLLKNAKLILGTKTPVDTADKNQDGKILLQDKDATAQVKENTTVNVSYYVYKEPKVVISKFVGFTVKDVKAKPEVVNGKVILIGIENAKDTDIIDSQSVAEGSEVAEGTKITLTSKAAAEKVSMPLFMGMTVKDAKKLPDVVFGKLLLVGINDAKDTDIIIGQSVAATTQVPAGTTVTLTVNKAAQ